jgi:hypothetical protein
MIPARENFKEEFIHFLKDISLSSINRNHGEIKGVGRTHLCSGD